MCQVQGCGIEAVPAGFGIKEFGLLALALPLERRNVIGIEQVLSALRHQQFRPVTSHPAKPVVQISSQVGKDA